MTDSQFQFLKDNLIANDPAGGLLWKADIIANVTASENLAQVNGHTVDVGTGVAGLGTQRIAVSSDSTINVLFPSGAQTLVSSVVTDDNTIAAGATSIMLVTSSDYTGNINGVARTASTTYIIEAVTGKTLPAITYTTTTGSITIDKLT